jgi:riboflavin kinase
VIKARLTLKAAEVADARVWKNFYALYRLAEMGASRRTIKVSTEYLAQKMGLSQQTASRHLIQLEELGWIQRTITPEGCLIKVTEAGKTELKRVYTSLHQIFEAAYPTSLTLEGVLFSGLGEGAYYISKDGYRKQFIEKLGFDPYPGTLNLKLTTDYDLKTMTEVESYPGVEIEGFKNETRSFGSVKCYSAIINNKVKGAVLAAMRTHYNSSVIEIIAPTFLRGSLKLKDGNKVKVEIFTLP